MSLTAYQAQVSEQTHEKIRSWYRLQFVLERAKAEYERVQKEFITAKNDLGDHLSPQDRKPGETFQIWYGSGLLRVTVPLNPPDMDTRPVFEIGWRTLPSPKQLHEML